MSREKEMMRLGCERVELWGYSETYIRGTVGGKLRGGQLSVSGSARCTHRHIQQKRFEFGGST